MRQRIAFLAVAAAVGLAPAARADQLDRLMVEQSAAVAKAVQGLGGKNIAVLKFDFQNGADKTRSFSAGTVNITMARRLENLLTLENDAMHPVNVLADAGEELARIGKETKQNITWRTDAGRAEIAKRLTGKKLSVLWDTSMKYTPDVYVTGLVQTDSGYATTTVTFYGFTAANPKELKTLYTLTEKPAAKAAARGIRTDRAMLASFGQSFNLKPKAKSRGFAADDEEAVTDAANRDKTDMAPVVNAGTPSANESPIKLQVFYDNVEQQMQTVDGESRMPSPNVGQKVHFQLTNTGADQYAVLLAVNGVNTNALDGDTLTDKMPGEQRKWVIDAGASYKIEGFYKDASGTYSPFDVLGEEESVRLYSNLSEQFAGKFSLYVFGNRPQLEGGDDPKASTTTIDEEINAVANAADNSACDLTAAPRGLPKDNRSLSKYQDALVKATHVEKATGRGLKVNDARRKLYTPAKARSRGMINSSATVMQGGEIKQIPVTFEPLPMTHYTITYYKKPSAGGN